MITGRIIKIITLVLLAVIASTNVPATDIYHWVDENGVQHFSQYRPTDNIPNVIQLKLEDATLPGDGQPPRGSSEPFAVHIV